MSTSFQDRSAELSGGEVDPAVAVPDGATAAGFAHTERHKLLELALSVIGLEGKKVRDADRLLRTVVIPLAYQALREPVVEKLPQKLEGE